jgi:pSer/pThr/pTyr-binding forkhead associated (FHA) protein
MAPSLLKVLGGPLAGKELTFEDAVAEVVIGADPACAFRLEGPAIARVHARIRREAGGVVVHDVGGPHVVFVNDDRVQGSAPLRSGDILWLGTPGDADSVMIRCQLSPPGGSAPVAAITPAVASRPTPVPLPAAASPAAEPELEPFYIVEAEDAGGDVPALVVEEFELDPPADSPPIEADPFFVAETDPAPAPPAEDAFFIAESEPPTTPPPAAPTPPPPQAERRPVPSHAPAPAPVPVTERPSPAPSAAVAPARHPAPPPVASASAAKPAARPTPPRPPAQGGTLVSPGARTAARPPEAPTVRPAAVTARARSEGASAPPARRSAPPPVTAGTGVPRYALFAAAAALVLAGGYLAYRLLAAPRLSAVTPTRARVGQRVTLAGRNFASDAGGNVVLFGDQPGKVVQATAERIEAEVPELSTTAGRDVPFAVTVEVAGRRTSAVEIQVFQTPRIHGLSPDVAMPGDELTLAGSGWGAGATVHFGALAADVLQTTTTSLRVRVPAIDGPAGTSVPVLVAMGEERSNEAPFVVGRLPLIQGLDPAAAGPGDVIVISGRGFHEDPRRNSVRVGGVPALVLDSDPAGLQVIVPWAAPGASTVEIRTPGSNDAGTASFAVAASADPVEWRFVAEPYECPAGHAHAFASTALGPAFAFSASGGKSAATRAHEAAQHLNEAAGPLRASLDAEFEARGASVRLKPRDTVVLEATAEDATAYQESGTRESVVTPERLASWWTALARDLVLVLLRSQRPSHAAASAEGRVLGDVQQAARRGGGFGLPRQVVTDLKPAQRQALRLLALRVPASLLGPAGTPGGVAASLRLQGNWTGFEIQDGQRKNIAVAFGRSGGTLTFTDGVGIGVPLLSAETPQRNALRFSAQVRGGIRYYLGNWDGERVRGRISADAAGRNGVGTFELTQGP